MTHRQAERQGGKSNDRLTDVHREDRQADRQTDRQAGRQTDRQRRRVIQVHFYCKKAKHFLWEHKQVQNTKDQSRHFEAIFTSSIQPVSQVFFTAKNRRAFHRRQQRKVGSFREDPPVQFSRTRFIAQLSLPTPRFLAFVEQARNVARTSNPVTTRDAVAYQGLSPLAKRLLMSMTTSGSSAMVSMT